MISLTDLAALQMSSWSCWVMVLSQGRLTPASRVMMLASKPLMMSWRWLDADDFDFLERITHCGKGDQVGVVSDVILQVGDLGSKAVDGVDGVHGAASLVGRDGRGHGGGGEESGDERKLELHLEDFEREDT